MRLFKNIVVVIIFFFSGNATNAQPGEKRIQYPWGLKNSYVGINIGHINYAFSAAQLQPGFTVESITIPHISVRLALYGYQFNKYVSAQITYMRPVNWVLYNNVNGDKGTHSVWMSIAGLTVAGEIPVSHNFFLHTEGGFGMVTRNGFKIHDVSAVRSTTYPTVLTSGALKYSLKGKWDLQFSTSWTPENRKVKQPHTIVYAAGFNYHLKELSKEKVEHIVKSNYYFPQNLVQLSYSTNVLGYGVNKLFSKTLPVFWGGDAEQKEGIALHFQRNIFHARKIFSFDWGTAISYWKSNELKDKFFTLSLYPVFRFTAIRSPKTDLFFEYTAGGPTFISKVIIDNHNTGRHFTFYDAMGIGMFTGKDKRLNTGIRIGHYSNGNIFPNNNGVKLPLTFSLGYVVK